MFMLIVYDTMQFEFRISKLKNSSAIYADPGQNLCLILHFLEESETNEVKVAVNGKRRRELSLAVPDKYCARTEINEWYKF